MKNGLIKIISLSLFIGVFASLPRIFAATINVPSATYPTINDGLFAANPGDTVQVEAGTYPEDNLVIDTDGVILKGAGAGKTFINLTGIGGTGVAFENVTSSTITGFTIKKADVGLVSNKSKKIKIANNIFIDNVQAFENRSSVSQLTNNTFHRNERAIFSNSSATVKNNIISGSKRYGVAGFKTGSITFNLFNSNALGNYSGATLSTSNVTGISPLFVNITSDHHLRADSPAIKKGDPSLKNVFNNTTSDIGAHGGPSADVTPATVTGVTATSKTTAATITWNKNSAYNVSGYKIYYGTTAGSLTSSKTVGDVSTADLLPSEITPDQKYYFAVTALADSNPNESGKSSEVTGAVDTLPPTVPANLSVLIGSNRLFLSWSASTDSGSGVKGYKVYYGTAAGSYGTPVDVGNTTSHELTGLTNDVVYYITVSAYDNTTPANESSKSTELNEAPGKVRGMAGLKDTGGCFIATAAYGSYEERHVKLLREFRDRYLIANCKLQIANCKVEIPNIIGRSFVKTYYKVSPPIADFIRDSELLRGIVRVALLPLIAMSWMLINEPVLCAALIALVIIVILMRTSGVRKNALRLTSYVSLLTFLLLFAAPASSLGGEKKGFSLGLTYGLLDPSSNEWKEIYDSEMVSNYRISLGYRFSPNISAEMGIGYLWKDGVGKTLTGRNTGTKVTFQQAPVDLTLLYRLKFRPQQLIVPYVGGGASYNLYWESVKDGDQTRGGMWGYHATGGVQLLLDSMDPVSARNLKEDYGINGTHLVIGATRSVINDLGAENIDIGGLNYQAGLVFEF